MFGLLCHVIVVNVEHPMLPQIEWSPRPKVGLRREGSSFVLRANEYAMPNGRQSRTALKVRGEEVCTCHAALRTPSCPSVASEVGQLLHEEPRWSVEEVEAKVTRAA